MSAVVSLYHQLTAEMAAAGKQMEQNPTNWPAYRLASVAYRNAYEARERLVLAIATPAQLAAAQDDYQAANYHYHSA